MHEIAKAGGMRRDRPQDPVAAVDHLVPEVLLVDQQVGQVVRERRDRHQRSAQLRVGLGRCVHRRALVHRVGQAVQVDALVLEGPEDHREVVQAPELGLQRLGEDRGELRVGLEALSDVLAVALRPLGQVADDGGQVIGGDGLEHIGPGLHDGLELRPDRPGDGGVVGQPRRPERRALQVHVLVAEEGLQVDERVRVTRDPVRRVDAQRELGVPAHQLNVGHRSDHHAAQAHVGAGVHVARLQPEVHPGGEDHREDGREELAQHGLYPAIFTVSCPPHMTRDRNRLTTTMVTIEVRMARPLAVPTPAGPPVAL